MRRRRPERQSSGHVADRASGSARRAFGRPAAVVLGPLRFLGREHVAFNGDAVRELAAQFLALAEKQRATVPLMIGHRLMGFSLHTRVTLRKDEHISITRSRFTFLPSIVRWRRDLAKTSASQA